MNREPAEPDAGPSAIRRHPIFARAVLITIGLSFALVVLAGVEVVFKFANDRQESRVVNAGDDITEFYLPLGYRPKASAKARARKTVDGEVVFDVTYTIDDRYRRVTPARPGATRALIFLGDSFVFGEGVADDETLPWRVAEAMPDTQVYNFGYSGYGPQQALALASDDSVEGALRYPDVAVLYMFIPGHVRRAIGAMRMWLQWGRHFPCYDAQNGDVTPRGSFVQARPWRARVYDVLGRSQALRYFNVDWPLRMDDRDLDITGRILAAAASAWRAHTPNTTVAVVMFPDMPNNEFNPSRMIPYLDKYDVPYLDLSKAIDMTAPGMTFLGDGHPTAQGYAAVAPTIVERLCESKHVLCATDGEP